GSGWTELRGDRARSGTRSVVGGPAEGTARQDVPAPAGAESDDPEAGGRRTAIRNPDYSGSRGADCRQAGAGTDLRGGSGVVCLRLSTQTQRSGGGSEST